MGMKRIGILCFWGVPNFGAWAQAYALNHVVRSLAGKACSVEHIDYLCLKHFSSYYQNDDRLRNNFFYSYELIPHTRPLTAEELTHEEFDLVITGSDAIWDFSIPAFGPDKRLIGRQLSAKRLIAYAPSFGTMCPDMEFEHWIKSGLEQYEDISVRDRNSAEIVNKLTGLTPSVVLDPALLWDFSDDPIVSAPALEPYILVYGSQWTDEFVKEAQKLAKKVGYKLVSAGYINSWCDVNFRLIELRGQEWVGLFKHSAYVITSLFHGLMLSLTFGKQVKFCRVPYVMNRSQSLLEQLRLEVYLSGQTSANEIFSQDINYSQVNPKLKQLKQSSREFLVHALGEGLCDDSSKG